MSVRPFPGPYRVEGRSIKAVSHGQWFTLGRASCARFTVAGDEATARLWGAAPDLLAALQDCITAEDSRAFTDDPHGETARDYLAAVNRIARQAIAKATQS